MEGGGGALSEFSSMSGSAEQQPQQQLAIGKLQKSRAQVEKLSARDTSSSGAYVEDSSAPEGSGSGLAEEQQMREREMLLRRLETCARAREESGRIMSLKFAQRDAVRQDLTRARRNYLVDLHQAGRERDERWARKLHKSPFATDLVAFSQPSLQGGETSQRRQRLPPLGNRPGGAQNANLFKPGSGESEELELLRQEKRTVFGIEKFLTGLREAGQSNARAAQVLQERRQNELEVLRQQRRIQEAISGVGGLGDFQ